jgi:hypothetical protein
MNYRETSQYADGTEQVRVWHRGMHAFGGIELGAWRRLTPGLLVERQTLPHAIGSAGVARERGERDLGRTSLRVQLRVELARAR